MTKKELFVTAMKCYKDYNLWEGKLYQLGVSFWERKELQELLMSYIELLNNLAKQKREDDYSTTIVEDYIFESEFMNSEDNEFYASEENVLQNSPEGLWEYLVKMNPDLEKDE